MLVLMHCVAAHQKFHLKETDLRTGLNPQEVRTDGK